MRPSVAIEALRAQRRALVVWCVVLAGLIAMYVAVYPSVRGSGSSFSTMIDEMPAAYKALFTTGSGVDFSTPAGYLNVELLSFMGPALLLIYAIGGGANGIAGEEDRRTLDLLLVNGVSRRRLVVEKMAAIAGGTALLVASLWVSLLAEGAVAGMSVPVGNSAAALVGMGLLAIEFGAVALFVGACTGRVGLSRAVPAVLAVAAYVVNALASLVGWLKPLRPLSPFFQYSGHDPLRHGWSPDALAVTVGSTLILVAASVVAIRRRDVGT
jgi:ABC-2 type transport system permease protein